MCHHTKKTEKVTEDSIGNLRVLQPAEGYRFSIDSLLLTDFASPRSKDMVLELGAGCGIISMLLAEKHPKIHVTAIEIQPALAALAQENVKMNRLDSQVEIIQGDLNKIAKILSACSFDYVVSNPPYRPPDTGRICRNSQEALARHEILTTLEDVIQAARYALKPRGKVAFIYPADRSVRLLAEMHKRGIEPKRARFVHPGPKREARLILTEGCKDAGVEIRVLPPLILT